MGGFIVNFLAIAAVAALLSFLVWRLVPGSKVRKQYIIATILLIAVLCSGWILLGSVVNYDEASRSLSASGAMSSLVWIKATIPMTR